MKTKTISILSTAALLSLAMFSVASAADIGGVNIEGAVNVRTTVNTDAESTGVQVNAQAEAQEGTNKEKATSSESATGTRESAKAKDNKTENSDNASSSKGEDANNEGELTSEEHRSAIASFVQSLLRVADREGGIGAQVREVAKAQNDSATTTEEAIDKVKSKGGISTFFFGSDYKSLGELRSEAVKTQNNIDQLKNALTKATSAADKVTLSAQITALENSQAKVNAFVDTHENTFSVFGWLVRMFSK